MQTSIRTQDDRTKMPNAVYQRANTPTRSSQSCLQSAWTVFNYHPCKLPSSCELNGTNPYLVFSNDLMTRALHATRHPALQLTHSISPVFSPTMFVSKDEGGVLVKRTMHAHSDDVFPQKWKLWFGDWFPLLLSFWDGLGSFNVLNSHQNSFL